MPRTLRRTRILTDPELALYTQLWKHDGTLFNSDDAYGHQLTVSGALLYPGRGRYFDGTDDKVAVGNPSVLNFNQQDFSLAVWAKSDSLAAAVPFTYIAKWEAATRQYEFYVRGTGMANPSKVGFTAGNGLNEDGLFSNSTLNVGDWNFVVGTYQDSATPLMIIYLNGIQDNSYTSSVRVGTGTENVVIGSRDAGVALNRFNGIIGEAYAWSRLLNPSEVASLYQSTKWRYA